MTSNYIGSQNNKEIFDLIKSLMSGIIFQNDRKIKMEDICYSHQNAYWL